MEQTQENKQTQEMSQQMSLVIASNLTEIMIGMLDDTFVIIHKRKAQEIH